VRKRRRQNEGRDDPQGEKRGLRKMLFMATDRWRGEAPATDSLGKTALKSYRTRGTERALAPTGRGSITVPKEGPHRGKRSLFDQKGKRVLHAENINKLR